MKRTGRTAGDSQRADCGELVEQAGLADARFAAHEHDVTVLLADVGKGLPQRVELRSTTDVRLAGRSPRHAANAGRSTSCRSDVRRMQRNRDLRPLAA